MATTSSDLELYRTVVQSFEILSTKRNVNVNMDNNESVDIQERKQSDIDDKLNDNDLNDSNDSNDTDNMLMELNLTEQDILNASAMMFEPMDEKEPIDPEETKEFMEFLKSQESDHIDNTNYDYAINDDYKDTINRINAKLDKINKIKADIDLKDNANSDEENKDKTKRISSKSNKQNAQKNTVKTMAEEKKSEDKPKYKYEDLINIEIELDKRKELMEIALSEPDESWKIHDSGDPKIKIAYKYVDDSNVAMVRGKMLMRYDDGTDDGINFYYNYRECGYDDVYVKAVANDDTTTELRIIQLIDVDHQITYTASNPGLWIVAPRDFVYISSRFKETEYEFEGMEYETIVGSLSYSVPDKHPLSEPAAKDHVRAKIVNSGYILSQTEEQRELKIMAVCYINQVDLGGMVPKWVINQMTPSKGMDVMKFVKNWKRMKKTMADRAKNDYKKDHKPLFDQHPKLKYVDRKLDNADEGQLDDEKEGHD